MSPLGAGVLSSIKNLGPYVQDSSSVMQPLHVLVSTSPLFITLYKVGLNELM